MVVSPKAGSAAAARNANRFPRLSAVCQLFQQGMISLRDCANGMNLESVHVNSIDDKRGLRLCGLCSIPKFERAVGERRDQGRGERQVLVFQETETVGHAFNFGL